MKKYLPYVFIALVGIAVIYFGSLTKQQTTVDRGISTVDSGGQTSQEVRGLSNKTWETKIDDQSAVTVSVTPLELGSEAQLWQFEISINTHSGSLDEDLTKGFILKDNQENTYSALSWDGSGPGGHHRAGTLTFKPIEPAAGEIELVAKNIGGVAERSFKWNLE